MSDMFEVAYRALKNRNMLFELLFKKMVFVEENVFPVERVPGLYCHDVTIKKSSRELVRRFFSHQNSGPTIFRILWVNTFWNFPETSKIVCWDCREKSVIVFDNVETTCISAIW